MYCNALLYNTYYASTIIKLYSMYSHKSQALKRPQSKTERFAIFPQEKLRFPSKAFEEFPKATDNRIPSGKTRLTKPRITRAFYTNNAALCNASELHRNASHKRISLCTYACDILQSFFFYRSLAPDYTRACNLRMKYV